MPHITRSSHDWKVTLQYQTSFLGQGSNETRFSGCIVSHMVMSDLDKIATWLSSGENAILMPSSYLTSICATTSPVFVSSNLMLWDCCDSVAATFPEGETIMTRRVSVSSWVSIMSAPLPVESSRSTSHILTLPSSYPTKSLRPSRDGQILLTYEVAWGFSQIIFEPVVDTSHISTVWSRWMNR